MARLTKAQEKEKAAKLAAREKKQAQRAKLREADLKEVELCVEGWIAKTLTAAADQEGITLDEAASRVIRVVREEPCELTLEEGEPEGFEDEVSLLLSSPKWTTPEVIYGAWSTLRVKLSTKERKMLGSYKRLAPSDVFEQLVLECCTCEPVEGSQTRLDGDVTLTSTVRYPLVFTIPESPWGAVATGRHHVAGGLRGDAYGAGGPEHGPVDKYLERYEARMKACYPNYTRRSKPPAKFERSEDYSTMQAEVRIDNPYESGSWMQASATPMVTQKHLAGDANNSIPRREPHGWYSSDNWVEAEIIEKLKKHKPIELDRNLPEPTRAPAGKTWKQKWEEAQDWSDPKPAKDNDDDDDRQAVGV
jgi:hypothetical protein